jgi:hypothetical protein
MPDGNGNYDWQARMKRLEDMMERNWADHERIDRNISGLHTALVALKDNTDKLVSAIRALIDRIPPESLR